MYIFSVLLRMRNISGKGCTENQNIQFMFNNFFSENRAVYEKMWENIVEPGTPHMTIWCLRIACWIRKATNTHTQDMQYLLLSHCNNGCTNALQCYLYTYIACLVQNREMFGRWLMLARFGHSGNILYMFSQTFKYKIWPKFA
jgi:hypothetical protein